MKRILVLLLILLMAIFVFTGCEGLVPSEGEGEGEGEIEGVSVEIEGMVQLGGKNWVGAGTRDITVRFPAPASNVSAFITDCAGNYGTQEKLPVNSDGSGGVVLFPNEDNTVWTGSACFPIKGDACQQSCCASYIHITSGDCVADSCISFPFIIDSDAPYAQILVESGECICEGCEITFKSISGPQTCAEDKQCCTDDCSGLAGWSISIFDEDPFNECCETPCDEPIYTCSGTDCPIECTTTCLEQGRYYVLVNLVDSVGNEANYYATIETGGACLEQTTRFILRWPGGSPPDNSYFGVEAEIADDPLAGWCADAYTLISTNTDYEGNVYSSTDLQNAPVCARERPWGSINWILNHWTSYTDNWRDAQVAMWNLIHNPGGPTDLQWDCICSIGSLLGDETKVNNIIADADPGYVPGPDDLAAAILLVDNLCPTEDEAKQMVFVGMVRRDLDCPPCELGEVLQYQQNDLGCTDWENPIESSEKIIGNCGKPIYI